MVDDVKDITEKAESKEALDRARLARERREAEQRKRLDELRAHAAAAQAQREKRDEDRRKRQADQRARDDDRRQQVEERKRAIWEASISRREALLQRERDRTERLERARAARSAPRPAFAFGSSTPRLLEPVDSAGFFWAARSTNPIDQMNFFESLAASTTNVMFVSAPLTRRASALQLDTSDTDNKDEADRSPQAVMWSSVARRRTDLVPTVPAPRAPGRAYSMTRLDKLPSRPIHSASPSMHHLNRSQPRSGETTPGSRPGSALSNATGVVRRASSAPRKPRPASIAGTGCNTPRGEAGGLSAASTPAVSRDGSMVARAASTPRRPRPLSLHVAPAKPATPLGPGEGKPPVHRKPKPAKEQEKKGGKSLSVSPGPRDLVADEMSKSVTSETRQVDAQEVTQKLEALQVTDDTPAQNHTIEHIENIEAKIETNINKVQENRTEERMEVQKETPKETPKVEPRKEPSVEKTEENEMTASMISRRITTEEEAKAALAERRRRAREELERQAELERLRLQREAEEEAERLRQEEERQRREEEEARELAALQRKMQDEKLKKAIEAQQQLEREEAERKAREEVEKIARAKEEEEKRKANEEAEKRRAEELEREEKERLARKQRVEAIMARTRLKKQAEEDKKKQEQEQKPAANQGADTHTQAQANDAPKRDDKDTTDSANGETTKPETINVAELPKAVYESVNAAQEPPKAVTQSVQETKSSESVDTDVKPVDSASTVDSATDNVASVTDNVASVTDNVASVADNVASVADNVASVADNVASVTDNVASVADNVASVADNVANVTDNGNGNVQTADLLSLATSQPEGNSVQESVKTNETAALHSAWAPNPAPNNGNLTADLLGLSDDNDSKDSSGEQSTVKQIDNATPIEANNGNVPTSVAHVGHISANFIQTERMAEHNQKIEKLLDDDFTTHNGHGLNHPLTLQNAI